MKFDNFPQSQSFFLILLIFDDYYLVNIFQNNEQLLRIISAISERPTSMKNIFSNESG